MSRINERLVSKITTEIDQENDERLRNCKNFIYRMITKNANETGNMYSPCDFYNYGTDMFKKHGRVVVDHIDVDGNRTVLYSWFFNGDYIHLITSDITSEVTMKNSKNKLEVMKVAYHVYLSLSFYKDFNKAYAKMIEICKGNIVFIKRNPKPEDEEEEEQEQSVLPSHVGSKEPTSFEMNMGTKEKHVPIDTKYADALKKDVPQVYEKNPQQEEVKQKGPPKYTDAFPELQALSKSSDKEEESISSKLEALGLFEKEPIGTPPGLEVKQENILVVEASLPVTPKKCTHVLTKGAKNGEKCGKVTNKGSSLCQMHTPPVCPEKQGSSSPEILTSIQQQYLDGLFKNWENNQTVKKVEPESPKIVEVPKKEKVDIRLSVEIKTPKTKAKLGPEERKLALQYLKTLLCEEDEQEEVPDESLDVSSKSTSNDAEFLKKLLNMV